MKPLLLAGKITLFFLCFSLSGYSQIVLKPSIGLNSRPNDGDPVCNIPTYIDPDNTYNTPGLQTGDTIPHFKLYKLNGDSVDILTELLDGKPILLVGANYTCPIYRTKVTDINNMLTQYGSAIKIFQVYIVEAHPNSPDPSPYSGTVWVTGQNQQAGILYNQPTTYLQRKNLVQTMVNNMTNNAPIIIDGPCNAWWTNFGTAPNSGFLLRPNGTIFVKHGWFHKTGVYNMYNDIDSLLNMLSIPPTGSLPDFSVFPNPGNGHFMVELSPGSFETAEVIDATGKVILEEQINRDRFLFDLNSRAPGVYYVKLTGREGYRVKKIIKQ